MPIGDVIHEHLWRPYVAADGPHWSRCKCGETAWGWPKGATHYMDDRGAAHEIWPINEPVKYDFGWEREVAGE